MQLNVMPNEKLSEITGAEIQNQDFSWESSNEEIASIDQNGKVTGLKTGYTSIYAKHKTYDIYAECIVNIYENIANPMAETGIGFSVVLKADGTVWTSRKK